MRELLLQNYKRFGLRQSILQHDLLKMPIGEVLMERERFLREMSFLPGVGPKAVEVTSYLLEKESQKFLSTVSGLSNQNITESSIVNSIEEWLRKTKKSQESIWNITGSFVPTAMDEEDKQPLWSLHQTQGKKIFYLPNTIPDIFKTADIWWAERKGEAVNTTYAQNLRMVAELAQNIDTCVTFILDENIWSELLERRGRYATLTEHQVSEQVDIMRSASVMFRDQVTFELASFQNEGLSTCFIVEGTSISSFWFSGYFRTVEPKFVHYAFNKIDLARREPLFSSLQLGPSILCGPGLA